MIRHLLVPAASLALLAVPANAQTIWSMGAPHQSLDQVIQLASPGDIVMLNGMAFPPFSLTKGLTLIGPGTIHPTQFSAEVQVTSIVIPTGQAAHLAALDFTPSPVLPVFVHRVEAMGTVAFESCTFQAGSPANLISSGNILLHNCRVHGGATGSSSIVSGGMRVLGGTCTIVGSRLDGASALFSGSFASYIVPPTPGLTVTNGTVLVSATRIAGGQGMHHPVFGAPAAGSPAAIAVYGSTSFRDCQLYGGGSPTSLPGPAALVGSVNASFARTQFVGGFGSPTGSPTSGAVQSIPQLVGMDIDARFRLGTTVTLTATAGSAQPLAMVASFVLAPSTHPLVLGAMLAPVGQAVPLAFVASSPSLVAHQVHVPNQPALRGTTLFAQACQIDGSVVRASPWIGGVVH